MSDLTASQCGCSGNVSTNGCGCNFLWILILLCIVGNNDGGCFGGFGQNGNGCGLGCDNWIWILLILCCCNNTNF